MSFRLAAQESTLPGRHLRSKFQFAAATAASTASSSSGRATGLRRPGRRAARGPRGRRRHAARRSSHTPSSSATSTPDRRRAAIEDVKELLSTTVAEAGRPGLVMPNGFAVFSTKLPPFTPPRVGRRVPGRSRRRAARARRARGRVGAEVFLEPLNRYEDYLINTLADAVVDGAPRSTRPASP